MQSSSSPLSTLQSHAESLDWLFAAAVDAAAAFILSSWPVKMRRLLTTLAVSLDAILGCAINGCRKRLGCYTCSSGRTAGKSRLLWIFKVIATVMLFVGSPFLKAKRLLGFEFWVVFQWPLLKRNLRQTFKICSRVLKSANNVPILWTGFRGFALQSRNMNEQFLWHLCFVPL